MLIFPLIITSCAAQIDDIVVSNGYVTRNSIGNDRNAYIGGIQQTESRKVASCVDGLVGRHIRISLKEEEQSKVVQESSDQVICIHQPSKCSLPPDQRTPEFANVPPFNRVFCLRDRLCVVIKLLGAPRVSLASAVDARTAQGADSVVTIAVGTCLDGTFMMAYELPFTSLPGVQVLLQQVRDRVPGVDVLRHSLFEGIPFRPKYCFSLYDFVLLFVDFLFPEATNSGKVFVRNLAQQVKTFAQNLKLFDQCAPQMPLGMDDARDAILKRNRLQRLLSAIGKKKDEVGNIFNPVKRAVGEKVSRAKNGIGNLLNKGRYAIAPRIKKLIERLRKIKWIVKLFPQLLQIEPTAGWEFIMWLNGLGFSLEELEKVFEDVETLSDMPLVLKNMYSMYAEEIGCKVRSGLTEATFNTLLSFLKQLVRLHSSLSLSSQRRRVRQ